MNDGMLSYGYGTDGMHGWPGMNKWDELHHRGTMP